MPNLGEPQGLVKEILKFLSHYFSRRFAQQVVKKKYS